MNAIAPLRRAAGEHRFFVGVAAFITATIAAGFIPNYIARALHHTLTFVINLHGLFMASWIALFLAQVLLVANNRTDVHRKLGKCGAVLIALIVPVGLIVVVHSAAQRAHGIENARFFLMLIAFDTLSLLVFACLAITAIVLRRRSDFHKRLMLLATLNLLAPGFGRLLERTPISDIALAITMLLLMQGCVLVCAAVDTFRNRRLHPAFAWAGSLSLVVNFLTCAAKTPL